MHLLDQLGAPAAGQLASDPAASDPLIAALLAAATPEARARAEAFLARR